MGWPTSRVLVIDQDLGTSGASTTGRVGFGRLVTEITMGHVGLVGGIEMSRLARSGADWYQLLELCALAGALLADADGIYDPVDDNDRLLLGLGGNNERGRAAPAQTADAGRQAGHGPAGRAGHRAAHRLGAPPLGEAALDPDEQVQTVVRLIVAKFAEPGTLHGVLGWLVDHHVQLGCGCGRGRTPGSWSGGGPTG